MALGDQLHCDLEMCPGSRRPAAHHGSRCRRCRQHAACILPSLQRPHRRWHRLVLICEACAVIHLWCYGCGGRFMTQNKLLRSCMWWGNQEGKWAGNSLLHATLIHPSVGGRKKKKTLPLCAPHQKKCPRIIIAGAQYTDPRSAAGSAEVSPAASGALRRLPNSSINSTAASLLCAQHKVAPCITSIWAENWEFITYSPKGPPSTILLHDGCDVYVSCYPYCLAISQYFRPNAGPG